MVETIATYQVQVSGIWNTRHEISGPQGKLGLLSVDRNGQGLIARARYVPEKGEVLHFRRDPGLLRSQFSMWTEGREWLGSSLRWSFVGREIAMATGNKPYRLVPLPGFRRGWRMFAPKTGETARIVPVALTRRTRVEVYRRVDFELLLFGYFLGCQVYAESFWPGPTEEADQESLPSPSKA